MPTATESLSSAAPDVSARSPSGEESGRPSAGPPRTGRPPLSGLPLLKLIRPLAAFAVLATILGRMASPAMVGLAVGIDRIAHAVEVAGAGLSQLFALGAVAAAMGLVGAVATGRGPYALRAFAIVAGSFVILVVLHATVRRVPGLSSALIGVSAGVLALGAAWDARRSPFARPVAAALGLVGASALVRLLGVLLAVRAVDAGSQRLIAAARVAATASFALDGCAALVVMALFQARRRGDADAPAPPGRAFSFATLAALAVAMLAARQGLAGGGDDAGALDTLVRRALEQLLTRPAPFLPLGAQLFVAALSVALATLAVAAPPRQPALSGALALLLLARSAPEVPLNALSLVIAALSVSLAARDERGFWASVLAGSREDDAAASKPDASKVRQVDADNDNR